MALPLIYPVTPPSQTGKGAGGVGAGRVGRDQDGGREGCNGEEEERSWWDHWVSGRGVGEASREAAWPGKA